MQAGSRALGRGKLQRRQQLAVAKQTQESELANESQDIQEADWLLDDDDLDEDEYEVEGDDEGPGTSGRLQASQDVSLFLQNTCLERCLTTSSKMPIYYFLDPIDVMMVFACKWALWH